MNDVDVKQIHVRLKEKLILVSDKCQKQKHRVY